MRLRGLIKHAIYSHVPCIRGAFPYFGQSVHFPIGSHLFHRTCAAGVYESDVVQLIVALMRPNTMLLDIGANIGLIAIPILSRLADVKVMSFEPSPNSLPYLERTARESSFSDRWTIVGQMAADSTGESSFSLSAEGNGAFDGAVSTGRVPVARVTTVQKTTVDAEWSKAGQPDVAVIKIDVEGAEKFVLKGSLTCIERRRPYILLEWNLANLKAYSVDPRELFAFAESKSYTICRMKDISPITSAAQLDVVCRLGEENFLLVPMR